VALFRSRVSRLRDAGDVDGLVALLASGDRFQRRDAARALGELGDERAVEPLVAPASGDRDGEVRAAAIAALGSLGSARAREELLALIARGGATTSSHAGEALAEIDPVAAAAALVRAERDVEPDYDLEIGHSLKRVRALVRERRGDRLAEDLSDPDPDVALAAATALGDRPIAGTVEALAAALRRDDPHLRLACVHALQASEDPAAADALASAVAHADRRVALAAADALRSAPSEGALDALAGVASDGSPELRVAGVRALDRVDGAASSAALLRAAEDPSDEVRMWALFALGWRGEPRAIELAKGALADGDRRVRIAAIDALAGAGAANGSEEALELVVAMCVDGERSERERAVEVVGRFRDRRAVDALVAAARAGGDSDDVRKTALRHLGETDERALPALEEALSDGDPYVAAAAVYGLGRLGGQRAVELLRAAAGSGERPLRSAALTGLGRTGDGRHAALIAAALRDARDHDTASSAAQALAAIGAGAELVAALDGRNRTARYAALGVLAGHPQRDAAGRLGELSRSEHEADARMLAVRALAAIADAQLVLPALTAALSGDRSDWVRRNAADAIGSLGDPAGVDALEAAASGDDDVLVRDAARAALARLSPPPRARSTR
jgi:HEAT repeat protein